MKVTRSKILKCVIESIRDVMPEEKADVDIRDDTDPIQHLGLDSFDGIAFSCPLSGRLGWDIPGEVNPFVDDERKRSRCVREIVDLLYQLMRKKAEEEDHE